MRVCIGPAYTTDVTILNPFGVIYVCGSETEDGSRRFICDAVRGVIRAEVRVSGVWVKSDLEFQIATVVIDDDLGELVLDEDGLLVYRGEDD